LNGRRRIGALHWNRLRFGHLHRRRRRLGARDAFDPARPGGRILDRGLGEKDSAAETERQRADHGSHSEQIRVHGKAHRCLLVLGLSRTRESR
jgi:hypothetical protein